MLCAAQVERALRRLEGVADVRVEFEKAIAHVQLKPGVAFEPDKLREAVQTAGPEKVRGFELRLRGSVERQLTVYYVRPAGLSQRFAFASGPLTAKVASLVGKQVRVRGNLVESAAQLELQLVEMSP